MGPKRQCQELHNKRRRYVNPQNAEVRSEAEAMFDKVFHYEAPCASPWALPAVTSFFTHPKWTDDKLGKMKEKLNEVKTELNGFDILDWHQHTQKTNPAGLICQRVRHTIQPELCTQAWCKFGEILAAFRITPSGSCSTFHSVHLCEAPGAFVTCLNHYLKNSGYAGEWKWIANTLNPYYEGNDLSEMIHDDRFIFNTMDRWYFGVDNTGNIMNKGNIQDLRNRLKGKCVHLVTADGSVDCANNPAEQESLVSQLHYCEMVAALHVLSPGGALVLKMFTLYEDSSVCLVYLLSCLFEKVSVFKPACSKAGNSEVYLVARNFHGVNAKVLELVTETGVGPAQLSNAMFSPEDLPDSFIQQHRACCQRFKDYQVSTIQLNLQLFHEAPCTYAWAKLYAVKECCATLYMERLALQPIHASMRITPSLHMGAGPTRGKTGQPLPSKYGKKRTQGSFLERQKLQELSWQQRLAFMEPFHIEDFQSVHVLTEGFAVDFSKMKSWLPIYGKPVHRVQSSPFCDVEFLAQYNDFLKHRTVHSPTVVDPSRFKGPFDHLLSLLKEPGHDPRVHCLNSDGQGEAQSTGSFAQFCLEAGLPPDANEDEGGSRIYCMEVKQEWMSANEQESEHKHEEFALKQLLHTLKKMLAAGDHVVFTSGPLLSRIAVGVVFLLCNCFKQICLFGAEDGSSERVYVAALSRITDCQELPALVAQLLEKFEIHDLDASQQLLEFVPVQSLHEKRFHRNLRVFNDEWLQRRMNWMLLQDQQGVSQDSGNM